MSAHFKLCDECRSQYAALRFDPSRGYTLCIIPYVSLVWPDEHPEKPHRDHKECAHSILRLMAARTALWQTGVVPKKYQRLWEAARRALPDWPGFQRLSLDAAQLKALDRCKEELLAFFGATQEDLLDVTIRDEGDGVISFAAEGSIDQSGSTTKH